jgi:hypothetical protein
MTLEGWNIVLNAVNAGLLLVGGFWLKHFVNQRIKAKDAVIELKNAEISHLQGESAPAIATKYKTMKEFADQMTKESQRLAEKLSEHQRGNRLSPLKELHGEAVGMLYAVQRMEETLSSFQGREFKPSEPIVAFITITRRLSDEVRSKFMKVSLMLDAEEAR